MKRFGLLWRIGWRIRETPTGFDIQERHGRIAALARHVAIEIDLHDREIAPRNTDLL